MATLKEKLLQVSRNLDTYAQQERLFIPGVPAAGAPLCWGVYCTRCREYSRALGEMVARKRGRALASEVSLFAERHAGQHNATLAMDPGLLGEEQRSEALGQVYATDKLLGDLEAIAGIASGYHAIPSLLVVQPLVGTSQIVHPPRQAETYRLLFA
jgi:hypothetical protein